MLKRTTIIHILDACDRILFSPEDAEDIRLMLEGATDNQILRCYRAYLGEIIRQCARRR